MPGSSYVFMVPGFLGFIDVGRFEYFRRVAEQLGAAHARFGISPTIVRVEVHPSASLRERATQLALVMREHVRDDGRPVDLVAHSTGGLDARLLLTPGVSLPLGFDLEPLAGRVRSLVTVATPHHGTPLAPFFDGLLAQRILRLGSRGVAQALRATRLPVALAERLARLLLRSDRSTLPQPRALAEARGELLDALAPDDREPLQRLLERMADDQALVPQLAPAGLELFNASTTDRPGVRYGCVVARAPRPGLRSVIRAGVRPGAQTSSALYSALHQIAARTPETRSRSFDRVREQEVAAAYGDAVDWIDSDGVVPTLSQVWGELVHAAAADHLDVVGHFADDRRPAEHHDVLVSGSSFGRAQFERLWHDVAAFVCRADGPAIARPFGTLSLPPAQRYAPSGLVPAASTREVGVAVSIRRTLGITAARAAAVTVAFVAYEAWRVAVGELAWAHWLGFAACVAAVVLVVPRLPRWLGRSEPKSPRSGMPSLPPAEDAHH